MNKLHPGQILYDYSLQEFKVSKVGHKYFECENTKHRFVIETLRSCSAYRSTQLYESRQPILDIKEKEQLESEIRAVLKPYGGTNLTIEQLRKISLIINEK